VPEGEAEQRDGAQEPSPRDRHGHHVAGADKSYVFLSD
jgi:hypothetical protein